MHITGLDQPLKRKELEVVKPTEAAQHDAPTQTVQVTSVAGGSTATMPEQTVHKDISIVAAGAGAGGSGTASWERYRERLVKEVQDFEQTKNKLAEERASFEAEKKAEEWGREGLKNKLQAAEELLSKERAKWKKVCEKDNQRMYAARSKITDLEAENATLKGKVEEAQADKERVEVELNARIVNKDKDLAAKDVEIAELKRRLFGAHDKNESLEIDLEA
ncbi:hypothetical protein Hanom_Chr13g01225971 [Helianthus anomalus]